jgi:GMP synthase-like glutamine amidotransferase
MTGPRILVLQHHPLEHPGVFSRVLARGGATVDVVRAFAGDVCPRTLAAHDGLLVMGGPMGVGDADAYPWLADERALVAAALAADLPTLGVCLGSQLIAAVAGAPVGPGPTAEIGWYHIRRTPGAADDPLFTDAPARFAALEWHREAFTLPPGAVALAASAHYPVQAFRIGRRVYGLLFHLETDPEMVDAWCDAFSPGEHLPDGDAAPDFAAANRRAITIAERLFLAR